MNIHLNRLIILAALLSASTLLSTAQAGQPELAGPSEGSCTTTGVVEPSRIAGYCVVDGVKKAWYQSSLPTVLINLKPLPNHVSCDSGFLSLHLITGTCDPQPGSAQSKVPVFWPVVSPQGDPLPFEPLARDTSSEVLASTLFGNVAGQSNGPSGGTAVVWFLAKKGEPQQVSTRNDNCRIAAISDSGVDSTTLVALNCPNASGTSTANVATFNGTDYSMKALKLPATASYCEAKGINGQHQVAGTCHYADNTTAATFWSGFAGEPKVLPSVESFSTEALFLNGLGNMVANVVTPAKKLPLFWPASAAQAQQVPMPTRFDFCQANAFAQSADTLLMTCAANDLTVPVTVFTWSPGATAHAIQPAPGADAYRGMAISTSASEAVGHFKPAPNVIRAFISHLP